MKKKPKTITIQVQNTECPELFYDTYKVKLSELRKYGKRRK